MGESKIWKRRIVGYGPLLAATALLTLSLTISCSAKKPIPFQADSAVCRDGNNEQLESWDRIVMLAKIDLDPYEIRAGTAWAGAHLWRCRNLTPQ